jgi:hypothetical protein
VSARAVGAATVAALAAASVAGATASSPVTPSGDTVPENLLRIELNLARPLRRPLAMDHVRLVDGDGAPLADALLDLPLPAADGRSVTILLHPGRVKTGVGANLALGRALRAGQEVELVVDDPQLDAPLHKRWHVTPAQDASLLARDWHLALPRVGTRAALRVDLDATLRSSGARLIAVRGPDGERLAGESRLRDGERAWEFRPARPWRAGHHALVLHPGLEDVAGNRPCAPFEAVALRTLPCPLPERGFELRR